VGEFLAKKVELETPNRTYCHQPICSKFIPRQFIDGEKATCIQCGKTTCVVCKGASHEGDCPHDPALKEVMRVAADNEWQQYPSCRRLIELDFGCYHMSRFPALSWSRRQFMVRWLTADVILHPGSLSLRSPVLLSLQPSLEVVPL
jgi:hypothetical protein